MKYLNLTEGFNPYGVFTLDTLRFETFKFPGGEVHFRLLDTLTEPTEVAISIRLNSSDDLMLLAMAADTLDRSGYVSNLSVFIPYFPGARQDRIKSPVSEPLSVKVYADFINEMNFDLVTILDPHSDVTPAIIDRVDTLSNVEYAYTAVKQIAGDLAIGGLLISPDAGSQKKIYDLAVSLQMDVVKASKFRNTFDGKLSGFEVHTDDLCGEPCYVIDDICDGGGTFIGLAKELKKKNAGPLYLIVTHGILSKGMEALEEYYDKVYITDSIFNIEDRYTPDYIHKGILNQIKIEDLTELK